MGADDDAPDVQDLLRRIATTRPPRRTIMIGIDGRGGSGKSTFARAVAEAVADVTVVDFDDFYRPSVERSHGRETGDRELGGDFDWRRLRKEVLKPLAVDQPARYRRYDWNLDRLRDDVHVVDPGGVVVVEGSYSTRPELRDFYDVTVWVDAPQPIRLRRGVERDGEDARDRWLNEWMPEEDRYIAAVQPAAHADVIIDGSR